MIAERLIDEVHAAGATLRAEPPDLVISPSGKISPELKRRLKERKSEVIAYLAATPVPPTQSPGVTEADSWEWIEERAALLEFNAGLTRQQADHQAFLCWFRRFVGPEK